MSELDVILEAIRAVRDDVRQLEVKFDAHALAEEARLDALERWRAYLLGAAAVVGAGGAVVMKLLLG